MCRQGRTQIARKALRRAYSGELRAGRSQVREARRGHATSYMQAPIGCPRCGRARDKQGCGAEVAATREGATRPRTASSARGGDWIGVAWSLSSLMNVGSRDWTHAIRAVFRGGLQFSRFIDGRLVRRRIEPGTDASEVRRTRSSPTRRGATVRVTSGAGRPAGPSGPPWTYGRPCGEPTNCCLRLQAVRRVARGARPHSPR